MRHELAPLFHLAKRVAGALAEQAVPSRGGFRQAIDRASLTLVTVTAKLFSTSPVGRRLRHVESLIDATATSNAIVGYLSDDICDPAEREALLELTRELAAELERRRGRLRALMRLVSAKDEIEEPLEIEETTITAADEAGSPAGAATSPRPMPDAPMTSRGNTGRRGPKTVDAGGAPPAVVAKNGHQTGTGAGSRG
jgi:hypothetical protein